MPTDTKQIDESKLPMLNREYVEFGIYTFADHEAACLAKESAEHFSDLSSTFMNLVYNIVYSALDNKQAALLHVIDEFTRKLSADSKVVKSGDPAAIEALDRESVSPFVREDNQGYVREDFLINESEDTAQWKYLLVRESGTFDVDVVNAVVAELKNDLSVTGSKLLTYQSRLRSIYEGLGVVAEQQPDFVRELPSMFLWRESTDKPLRFMLAYSNNSLDSDTKEPVLFMRECHLAFAELANAGFLPMPEAWLWHTPGTRWGVVDHILVLEGDDGFVLPIAIGTVDSGKEHIAENLYRESDLLVSQGVPRSTIIRSDEDSRFIKFAVTKEISPLPNTRAANKLTALL